MVGLFAIVKAGEAIRALIHDYLHAQPQVMIVFRLRSAYSGKFLGEERSPYYFNVTRDSSLGLELGNHGGRTYAGD